MLRSPNGNVQRPRRGNRALAARFGRIHGLTSSPRAHCYAHGRTVGVQPDTPPPPREALKARRGAAWEWNGFKDGMDLVSRCGGLVGQRRACCALQSPPARAALAGRLRSLLHRRRDVATHAAPPPLSRTRSIRRRQTSRRMSERTAGPARSRAATPLPSGNSRRPARSSPQARDTVQASCATAPAKADKLWLVHILVVGRLTQRLALRRPEDAGQKYNHPDRHLNQSPRHPCLFLPPSRHQHGLLLTIFPCCGELRPLQL